MAGSESLSPLWTQVGVDGQEYWVATTEKYELVVEINKVRPGTLKWKIVQHDRTRRWYALGCPSVTEAMKECERFLVTVQEAEGA